MKKALAFISALALGSASQHDDDFLSYRQSSIQSLPYRKPASRTTFYADDEQYRGWNIVQNWQDPLPPLPMMTPAEVQAHLEEEGSIENVLVDLAKIMKEGPKGEPRMDPTGNRRHIQLKDRVVMSPSEMKRELQNY